MTNKSLILLKKFKTKRPELYQFIMFNLLSNVATITNFVVLWLGTGWLFKPLQKQAFYWWMFNYPAAKGGLGGFLSFLIAYILAQIVNFFVQRKLVFGATVKIRKVIIWYILTVLLAGIISIWLPPYVIGILNPYIGSFSATVANMVNIVVQVAINYPMMKFVIMK